MRHDVLGSRRPSETDTEAVIREARRRQRRRRLVAGLAVAAALAGAAGVVAGIGLPAAPRPVGPPRTRPPAPAVSRHFRARSRAASPPAC